MSQYVVLTRAQAKCLLALADVTEDRTRAENEALLYLADEIGVEHGLLNGDFTILDASA